MSEQTTSDREQTPNALYVAVKSDQGWLYPIGGITDDKQVAKAEADQSLTGAVMRLVPADVIDEDLDDLIESRSDQDSDSDLVVVPRDIADAGRVLAECEVKSLELNPNPNADLDYWRRVRDAFADACDE